ncbi:uncharacterized protein A4U43_C01F25460 [Asparagus officinalis]|uniref:Uncharacterized protein n=1 Tax=Asparagus officinalis TaxID=4686 RepID=A0A5P1FSX3_ASPOF|nr:uncharacterized protein A4U43_C01F25460 [Asparagus officinalis]
MVAGKVKAAMGFHRSPSPGPCTPRLENPRAIVVVADADHGEGLSVQPRPPDVSELLKLVEELQERESRLRTELLEHKLLKETVAIVPFLEKDLALKTEEVDRCKKRMEILEANIEEMEEGGRRKDERISELEAEIEELKKKKNGSRSVTVDIDECSSSSQRFQALIDASAKSNLLRHLKKCSTFTAVTQNQEVQQQQQQQKVGVEEKKDADEVESDKKSSLMMPKAPRIPKPPPLPSFPSRSSSSSSSSSSLSSSDEIKTDVETQRDFIRFLIKEVNSAAFTNIEDLVAFVKWLDDELSYLVDERAVLKHFDWPEQKADAMREAAFGQPCSSVLKKMQALLEKLEQGVYNLSRMREVAVKKYKGFQIPWEWMLDAGFVSQIKLASVKLAMKYMKRVSSELESVAGGPEEEELMLQGAVRFRLNQFAGGFDVETMRAFQELRDKVCALQSHKQTHNEQQQQQQKLFSRSMSLSC